MHSRFYRPAILLSAVMIMVAYHHFAYIGHYGFDDMGYARIASNMLQGNFDVNDNFAYRFTVLALTMASYAIFGISDFASSLPAMLATTGILIIITLVLRQKSLLQLCLALIITLLSHWFIFYSDKLMADMFVALSVMLAVYTLYKFRYGAGGSRPVLYGSLLSASLMVGFMSKGTILLILPWLLYMLIMDLIRGRNGKFWTMASVAGAVMLGAYFLGVYLLSGNFMARFDAIASNAYLNRCSYDIQSASILLERITRGFAEMGIRSGLLAGFIFVLAGLVSRRLPAYLQMNSERGYFLTTALLLVLAANFMSISPFAYIPMCLDVRHYLYLYPVVAIPASAVICDLINSGRQRYTVFGLTFLVALAARFIDRDIFENLYLPLAVLFFILLFLKTRKRFAPVIALSILIFFGIKPWNMIAYAKQLGYRQQKEFIFKHILSDPRPAYILTDAVEQRLGTYYGGFTDRDHIFIDFQDYNPDTLDNRRILLLRNWYTGYLIGLNDLTIPSYILRADSTMLIASDERFHIALYDAGKIENPLTKGRLIYRSDFGLEKQRPFWKTHEAARTNTIVHSGDYAEKIGEYSTTFQFPIDSIKLSPGNELYVWCRIYTYFESETGAQLVASVEDSSGTVFRKALPVSPFQKAFSNWWPVTLDFFIDSTALNPNAVLKIYLWNPDREEAFADDFSVEFRALSKP